VGNNRWSRLSFSSCTVDKGCMFHEVDGEILTGGKQ
jgi:hypothetical protein